MDIEIRYLIETLKTVENRQGQEGVYFETFVQGALDWRASIYTIDQAPETSPMPTKAVFMYKRGKWHLIQFG